MKKLKAGIFDGPQIRKLIQDQAFTSYMTAVECAIWCSYVSVGGKFLRNTKASNYRHLVDLILRNFQALGARRSIKLHYLLSHLNYFPKNLGDVSEEQGGVPPRYQDNVRKIPGQMGRSHDVRLLLNIDL